MLAPHLVAEAVKCLIWVPVAGELAMQIKVSKEVLELHEVKVARIVVVIHSEGLLD